MIVKRLQYSGSRVWRDQDFINQVTDAYNNDYVHRTTGMTPYQGKQSWNRQNVKEALEANRKMNRAYPKLQIGDNVKVLAAAAASAASRRQPGAAPRCAFGSDCCRSRPSALRFRSIASWVRW